MTFQRKHQENILQNNFISFMIVKLSWMESLNNKQQKKINE